MLFRSILFLCIFFFYGSVPWSEKSSLNVKSIDQRSVINNSDVVLLIASESNLVNMPWGFVDDALDILHGHIEDPAVYDQKIQEAINRIKSDENWMKSIAAKAKGQNIPVDSMLILDAHWVVENE